MNRIVLPGSGQGASEVTWEDLHSLVIVGANGSGKSRLGAWLDARDDLIVHRVSAQRALSINEFVTPRPLEQASRQLLFGHDGQGANHNNKIGSRWANRPISAQAQDFEPALQVLFAQHSQAGVAFRAAAREMKELPKGIAETKLEIAERVWNSILPHRELQIDDNKISVKTTGIGSYPAGEMSDGERVALYLIAQCLAAPEKALLVLDEPELHIHQSIQSSLWDELEAARKDCTFVYITHDLGFAATRVNARKIWVQSYDGSVWEWDEIPTTDKLPEALVLQILGSRRPILFVEGDAASMDTAIYRVLFPGRLVFPCGSCQRVVDFTVAVRSLTILHHAKATGIIDRDRRSDSQLEAYTKHGVFTLAVAEVENLLLVPEIVRAVSSNQKRNPDADLINVQNFLFKSLNGELDVQVNERATYQIQQALNSFPGLADTSADAGMFVDAVSTYLKGLDPAKCRADSEVLFREILQKRDYSGLLKFYNRKSLAVRISRNLGLAEGEFPKLALRLLKDTETSDLRDALKSYLPELL
jgi:ABC-type cobalamin/Fe3+-siderophores transport system ATPase subunit